MKRDGEREGSRIARLGIGDAVACPGSERAEALDYFAGAHVARQKAKRAAGVNAEAAERELGRGGKLTLGEALRRRGRSFIEGVAWGSAEPQAPPDLKQS